MKLIDHSSDSDSLWIIVSSKEPLETGRHESICVGKVIFSDVEVTQESENYRIDYEDFSVTDRPDLNTYSVLDALKLKDFWGDLIAPDKFYTQFCLALAKQAQALGLVIIPKIVDGVIDMQIYRNAEQVGLYQVGLHKSYINYLLMGTMPLLVEDEISDTALVTTGVKNSDLRSYVKDLNERLLVIRDQHNLHTLAAYQQEGNFVVNATTIEGSSAACCFFDTLLAYVVRENKLLDISVASTETGFSLSVQFEDLIPEYVHTAVESQWSDMILATQL